MSNEAYAASFAQEVAELEANSPAAVAARKAAAEAYVKQLETEEAYKTRSSSTAACRSSIVGL